MMIAWLIRCWSSGCQVLLKRLTGADHAAEYALIEGAVEVAGPLGTPLGLAQRKSVKSRLIGKDPDAGKD